MLPWLKLSLLPLAMGLRTPAMPPPDRRSVLAAAVALVASPIPAHASYRMQQAAVAGHSWEATGKEREKATYMDIEATLDGKKRFRPEAGTLGYVGGEYTKKS